MKISPVAFTSCNKGLVVFVAADAAEANDGECTRRAELPFRRVAHPLLEERGESHVLADLRLEAGPPVAAQHGPEAQRAERPSERNADLAEAEHVVAGPQELRHQAERAPEVLGTRRPQAGAAHSGEQPLVRVDDERVGAVDAVDTMLRTDPRGAGVRSVDVEPRVPFPARDLDNG